MCFFNMMDYFRQIFTNEINVSKLKQFYENAPTY